MRPIVADRVAWSVGLSVCHSSDPCKTAESIDMPFELRTRQGPKEPCITWVHIPYGKEQFFEGAAHFKV